jgi:hypothetical protein
MATMLVFGGCTENGDEEEKTTTAKIHGSVVANGEPVNAAAVLLTPGGGTKITGSDGMYEFSGLQPGRYELKIYKEGFQSFNKSIDLTAGKNEELAITLSASQGKLSLNKAYIDMGSNESNNAAGFSIGNSGSTEMDWKIINAAGWITNIDPQSGKIPNNGSAAVTFMIDRSKLSSNNNDNYATLVVSSTSDGSTAELLVTVFGKGDGTNTTIGSDKDYIVIGSLYVQTKDLGGRMDWTSANNSCETSTIGGFDDWHLPSIGELGTLYSKKEAIGEFVINIGEVSHPSENDKRMDTGYWSGNESDYYGYYWMSFYDGNTTTGKLSGYSFSDNGNRRCRCVRKSAPLPQVSTLPATNVTATTATINGKIENKGEPAYTERGFVYSNTFQNPTVEDDASATTKRVVSGTSVDFSANIAGLTTETTYYVRAYATNSNGTVYGESVSFKHTAIVDYVVLSSANIAVQKTDISTGIDWTSAQSLCTASRVGGYSDWRLPTIGELSVLYTNRTTIGGFSTTSGSNYWSSTVYSTSYHYYYSFSYGEQSYNGTSYSYRVRAVRTLP